MYYSLEPPRRGGSNEYPQSLYLSINKKTNVYPCKPQFHYIKMGLRGSKLYRHVFVMEAQILMGKSKKNKQKNKKKKKKKKAFTSVCEQWGTIQRKYRLCLRRCHDEISTFIVCLFVLRFYSPVNPMGSCRAWSVYLTTPLLGRLS